MAGTREDFEDFFAPFLRVSCKRMFGGHGIYAGERIIAITFDSDIFLKVDDQTRDFFLRHGSTPFVYEKKAGEQMVMSYFSVPAEAYDDEGLRRACIEAALAAAERAPLPKKKASKQR